MDEDIMNNEIIKRMQKIEDKYMNKYLSNEVKELVNDVIKNKCKDFKENIFYKEVVEIDEELTDIFPSKKNNIKNKKKKRLKIYSDSEDDEENENNKKVKK